MSKFYLTTMLETKMNQDEKYAQRIHIVVGPVAS